MAVTPFCTPGAPPGVPGAPGAPRAPVTTRLAAADVIPREFLAKH